MFFRLSTLEEVNLAMWSIGEQSFNDAVVLQAANFTNDRVQVIYAVNSQWPQHHIGYDAGRWLPLIAEGPTSILYILGFRLQKEEFVVWNVFERRRVILNDTEHRQVMISTTIAPRLSVRSHRFRQLNLQSRSKHAAFLHSS